MTGLVPICRRLNSDTRANDVLDLVRIYQGLQAMMEQRNTLRTGASLLELNAKAQQVLPSLVELLVQGYGDLDGGWQTSLFCPLIQLTRSPSP